MRIDIIEDMTFSSNGTLTSYTINDTSLDDSFNQIKITCNDKELYFSLIDVIRKELRKLG